MIAARAHNRLLCLCLTLMLLACLLCLLAFCSAAAEPVVWQYEELKKQRRQRLLRVADIAGLIIGLVSAGLFAGPVRIAVFHRLAVFAACQNRHASIAHTAVERRRVFSQVFGERTWKVTSGEVARAEAAKTVAEKEKKRQAMLNNYMMQRFGWKPDTFRRSRRGKKGATSFVAFVSMFSHGSVLRVLFRWPPQVVSTFEGVCRRPDVGDAPAAGAHS